MTKIHMSGPRLAERAQLNRRVLRHLYLGDMSKSDVADHLGISRAELERKLDEDGSRSLTGFELLKLFDVLVGLPDELGYRRTGGVAKAPLAAGAESMREIGELLAELVAAVENGITEVEATSMQRSLAEARQSLNNLEASIAARVVVPLGAHSKR